MSIRFLCWEKEIFMLGKGVDIRDNRENHRQMRRQGTVLCLLRDSLQQKENRSTVCLSRTETGGVIVGGADTDSDSEGHFARRL